MILLHEFVAGAAGPTGSGLAILGRRRILAFMCLPLWLEKMARAVRRRDFLRVAGTGLAAVGAGQLAAREGSQATVEPQPIRYARVVDLTHTLAPDFPTFSGQSQFALV